MTVVRSRKENRRGMCNRQVRRHLSGGPSFGPIRLQDCDTVRQSAKTVIVTAGAVTGIAINGTSTGLSEGVFKLGIGETIAVTYSVTPTSTVWAD
jgi:hypothetical protein